MLELLDPPQSPPQTPSPSSATELILGRTEPRLWTPPLRELTPDTSYGFDVIDFARDVLGRPLFAWQEFAVIHAGELLPDGTPRFRKVLVLVARQNGKTELLVILTAYWMFIECVAMILGTSTKLSMAKESWTKMMKLVERTRALDKYRNLRKWSRTAAGEEECFTLEGSRYKISASNEDGGRGLTIHRLILDELRHHRDYRAWSASVHAGNAVPDFQAWGISNAGTDASMVLNEQRALALDAIKQIERGESADTDLCLLEWSAPEGSDPLDMEALAQANPSLGRGGLTPRALLGDAKRASENGGEVLAEFLTENMCIHVSSFDSAIDHAAWDKSYVQGDLRPLDKSRITFCLDVSPDNQHATLAAAAVLADDRVRVEVVNAWDGPRAIANMRRELRSWLDRRKPQTLGYLPNGPAAPLVADLRERKGRQVWQGVTTIEIGGEVSAVCMGFAEQVASGSVVHDGNDLLTDHVKNANKLFTGDVWRFSRKKGEGNCDAAYAAAGALHLARTLPTPPGDFVIMLAKQA